MITPNKVYKIAVYGNLRKDLSLNSKLIDADYIGEFQSEPLYSLYNKNYTYPLLKVNGNTSITMEVYKVTILDLPKISLIEGFDKENLEKNSSDRFLISTPYGKAFCFKSLEKELETCKIKTGDWKEFSKYNKTTKYANEI